jgi:type IV pilus assembly protein PilA
MKFMKKKNNKGFSLVELIVVIAIMAVLVGVLAPSFLKYVESSRQSTDIQNVEQLKTAVETRCAELEYTNKVEIEVGTTKATVKFLKDDGTEDTSQTLDSTSEEVTLKSSGWSTAVTYTYDPISAKWTATDPSGTTKQENDNAPQKDMYPIFCD